MADRFKRIGAFILDWNIIFFACLLVNSLVLEITYMLGELYHLAGVLSLLISSLVFVVVVLRDVIFKGRSLGKRIFGLYILDKNTLTEVPASRRFLKNLFVILYPIDAILLLVTGETIGDRAANTTVISKKSIEKIDVQERIVTS